MIKVEELRIENYVNFMIDRSTWMIGKVKAINPNKATVDNYNIKYCNLSPIKLTEELLLKCGFKKEPNLDDTTEFIIGDFSIQRETYRNQKEKFQNEFRYWSQHLNENGFRKPIAIEIKHLHQLQNLFYTLKQKELEINL